MRVLIRAILIVGALLCFGGQRATASDGGWLLWVVTTYFRLDGVDVGDGYRDRWAVYDGYDTAADCHAAAREKAETMDKAFNALTAKRTPIGFIDTNKCFPVGFDPRTISK